MCSKKSTHINYTMYSYIFIILNLDMQMMYDILAQVNDDAQTKTAVTRIHENKKPNWLRKFIYYNNYYFGL